MDQLVSIINNDIFTDSRIIAEASGNQHHAIRQLIKKYRSDFEEFGTLRISNEESSGGRPAELILLNEEQATLLLTYLKNSEKVRTFKKELVRQFYEMRRFILERQSQQWIDTRYQGKLTRKTETDTIKKLTEYAKGQGSKNADKLYVVYSKLANNIAGVYGRDQATINQLNNLNLIENIILHCVEAGIMADRHYKEIYQDCKRRLLMFKDLAYLEETA